jgi:DNA-directed RNA polymerase subunit beta'
MRVHEGDQVRAGDRLSEGPINPHDVLRIKGPRAVQEYLLNEIQEVYRLQGVKINDKHIGVIVRQMLQKVRVTDPGDTKLLEGEHVDRVEFREVNQRAIGDEDKPARSEPLLLGITKASLTTESFISAASFQETTRVLTDAAVRGARDDLKGLKENIIIGHLIPAGTGIHRYHEVEFMVEQSYYDEEIVPLTEPGELIPGLGAPVEEATAD